MFKILGSSSSGNAGLLRTPDLNILIDAGLSCRKLKFLLNEEGVEVEQLDAVFLVGTNPPAPGLTCLYLDQRN